MKRLFVWLASVSICTAQAVSIGPFATEDWVDERLQVLTNDFATIPYVDDAVGEVEDKIPDVSVYATKSYVNAVSNAIPDVSGFATKSYVDSVSNTIPDISGLATVEYVDAVSNAIPDTSAFSTVEYVNTTSNNLALLMDDLVSEEELGSSVSNIVPGWALVPVPPVIAEVDPAFTNWLATTNVVIDDNVGTFVSNVVPSWALVPIPPVTVEVDPAFTNWLATTNAATVQYVDTHKWDWGTQVTNAPGFVKKSGDIMTGNLTMYEPQNGATIYFPSESNGKLSFGSGLFDVNDDTGHVTIHGNEVATVEDLDGFAPESIQLPPYETAATLRYEYNGSRTFYYNGTNSTVGLFMVDNKGDPYISACNGQYASLIDPVFFDNKREAFEDIYGNNVRVDTTAFSPTCFMDNSNSNRYLWLTTNGVLKAGTVATVEDLAGVIENSDIVINNITNTEFTIEYTNPTEFFTYSNAVGHTDILLGTIEHAFDNGSLDVYPGGVGASVDGDVEITKYNIYLPESVLTFDSIAPMFSTNNVYTNGDFVIRNRHLYECTNYTGQAGWRANDWRQTTVTGILGNLRAILDAINGEAL